MDTINNFTFVRETEPRIRTNGGKRRRAIFRCGCGSEKEYDYSAVTTGYTTKCLDCAVIARNLSRITHNDSKHKLYRKWQDMKNRCYNPNVDRYPCYGGRGISVCEDWKLNFVSFRDWCIENGWKPELQVDRIDVNGNYEPSNCRIVTAQEQHYNKRTTKYVDVDGKKVSLSKLMNLNGKSEKYNYAWFLISKKEKSIEYVVEKYGLKTDFLD